MPLHKKYFKYGVAVNTFFWTIFLIIPYLLSGKTFTVYLNSIFGRSIPSEHYKTILLLYGITLLFSWALMPVFDFYLGFLFPDKWLTVTLIKKHKRYYDMISQGTGLPISGYDYAFDFKDKKGKKHTYKGSSSQYDTLKNGEVVRIRVKALMLIDIASADQHK